MIDMIDINALLVKKCGCGDPLHLSFVMHDKDSLFIAMQYCKVCEEWASYRVAVPEVIADIKPLVDKIREKFV